MGTKSTVTLTRDEALSRVVGDIETFASTAVNEPHMIPSDVLSAMLELLNDWTHGVEGFENYRVEGEIE